MFPVSGFTRNTFIQPMKIKYQATLIEWKKVLRVDAETGNTCHVYVGPRGQICADLETVLRASCQHEAAQKGVLASVMRTTSVQHIPRSEQNLMLSVISTRASPVPSVPRLPRKVTRHHRRPSASPEPAQCRKCHACHAKVQVHVTKCRKCHACHAK